MKFSVIFSFMFVCSDSFCFFFSFPVGFAWIAGHSPNHFVESTKRTNAFQKLSKISKRNVSNITKNMVISDQN